MRAVLRDVFGLHELPVEAAVQRETHPEGRKLRPLSLHRAARHQLPGRRAHVRDARDRLLPRRRISSSPSTTASAAASRTSRELCGRADHILAEGPVALLHRIVDTMVDHYRPEVDELEERLDDIEKQVIEDADASR